MEIIPQTSRSSTETQQPAAPA